jgi:hypothetical protein
MNTHNSKLYPGYSTFGYGAGDLFLLRFTTRAASNESVELPPPRSIFGPNKKEIA